MKPEIELDINTIIKNVGPSIYDFEGKEILITGGSGFLGSWFVAVFDYLNTYNFIRPCKVFIMDSGIATDKNNLLIDIKSEHILYRQDDISTAHIEGSVDFIIHAAGIASPIYYRKFPIETIEGMGLGLINLLKFAVKNPVESFLYFSSSEMYGNPLPEFVPTKEDYNGNVSCLGPRSCYDETKRFGETVAVAYQKVHKVPIKWVRPFNVYGPGMRPSDDRVVPKFIYQMIRGENITVHMPGEQTRTFCYITDAMTGFFKVLLSRQNGQVFNIGADEPELTMKDLAIRMRDLFMSTSEILSVEMPPEYPRDQAQRRCPDISKARKVLGYDPDVYLEEGLKKTYDWAKGNI